MPHAFLVSGWVNSKTGSPLAKCWSISNVHPPGASDVSDTFSVRDLRAKGRVWAWGAVSAFDRGVRRRLKARIRKAGTPDEAERTMVHAVREAASTPAAGGVIGEHCLAVAIAADGSSRARYFPNDGPPHAYGPFYLWHEGGRNLCIGDDSVLGGSGYSLAFGMNALSLVVEEGTRGDAPPSQDETLAGFSVMHSPAASGTPPTDEVRLLSVDRRTG